ncbi:sensor histidine kinase [Lederbergia citri]|uniref:histidine kinase n=1 Tax=Lederbergia citri TaxID=2833580 RepID=A0A942TGH7_9BACI|nr:histidine kinase [Lederbergia citri]MBS4197621.1 sensor histidine kinase [Lederbergia citri]
MIIIRGLKINSLKKKILLWFVVISSIVVFFHLVVFQQWISSIIQEKSDSYFRETVRQIGKRVEMQYQKIDEDVNKIKNNQVIKNYLKDIENDRVNFNIAKFKITKEIFKLSNLDMIDNIYIIPVNYKPMNLYYSSPIFEIDQQTRKILESFDEHKANDVIWSTETSPLKNTVMMFIHDNGELLGLLRVDVSEKILKQMDEVQLGYEGNIYLVKDHKVIFAKNRDLINKSKTILSQISGTKVSYLLDYHGWELIGVVPDTEIVTQVQEINHILLIMVLAILTAIFIFAMITARLILRPLKKILGGIEKVQQGNLDVVIEDTQNDEYSTIIHHFNYMVEKVNTLIQTVYKKQLLNRKAEMANLQSKLNPHFLYNTLDMIYWMLIMKDDEQTGDVIRVLSDILRYSITHQDDFVTVGEDMYQLENYLHIQSLRYEEKLQYSFHIDPSISEKKIPKLLIQPLVENSIKYAFREMKDGGKIQIIGYGEENDIIFNVVDNGCGMSKDQLELLYKKMSQKEEGVGGIGIWLVQQRIKYFFGENYGVSIDSSINQGTKITVTLKKRADFKEEYWTETNYSETNNLIKRGEDIA